MKVEKGKEKCGKKSAAPVPRFTSSATDFQSLFSSRKHSLLNPSVSSQLPALSIREIA